MVIAPTLVKRLPGHAVVAIGLGAAASGALLISQVYGAGGLAWFVIGSTVLNAGIGTVLAVTLELVVSAAPTEHAGAASGLAETGTELGGALGIAQLGGLAAAFAQASASQQLSRPDCSPSALSPRHGCFANRPLKPPHRSHDHHRERVATHLRTRGRPNGAGPACALTDDRCQPRRPAVLLGGLAASDSRGVVRRGRGLPV